MYGPSLLLTGLFAATVEVEGNDGQPNVWCLCCSDPIPVRIQRLKSCNGHIA